MIPDMPPMPPADLGTLLEQSPGKSSSHNIPDIRYEALTEAAFTYGARSGLAYRSYEIAGLLKQIEGVLNRSMRFDLLMLDNNVVPPVLTASKSSMKADGERALRLADASYRIEKNAYFSTTPLTWHSYLLTGLTFEAPKPHSSLLPRNKEEKKEWDKGVKEGWEMGVQQAELNFTSSLHRMEMDIQGMVLYRDLLAQNMVSKPYVAEAKMGVTGGANEININDRVLRITAVSELNADSGEWKPRVTPEQVTSF